MVTDDVDMELDELDDDAETKTHESNGVEEGDTNASIPTDTELEVQTKLMNEPDRESSSGNASVAGSTHEGDPNNWRKNLHSLRTYWNGNKKALFITFLGLGFAISVIVIIIQSVRNAEPKPCCSKSCVIIANKMLQALDESKDPCDDFYDFACGDFIYKNPDLQGQSAFEKEFKENAQMTIRVALESINITNNSSSAKAKARIFYESCINDVAKENVTNATLRNKIKELGGWHLLPNSKNANSSLQSLQLLLQSENKYFQDSFFYWAVIEGGNLTKQMYITPAYWNSLKNESNFTNKIYLEYMINTCVLLGADELQAREEMRKVLELEIKLANIKYLQNVSYIYTIDKMLQLAPFLNWTLYFKNSFNTVNLTISGNERILVDAPEYFEVLNEIIQHYSNTADGQRIITSYVIWNFTKSMLQYLPAPYPNALPHFLSNSTLRSWSSCVSHTSEAFGRVVDKIFVDQISSDAKKQNVNAMFNNTRNVFLRNLEKLSWIDNDTEAAIRSLAERIILQISPDVLTEIQLNKQYKELKVKQNDYLENKINILKFKRRMNMRELYLSPDKWDVFDSKVTEMDAGYSQKLNRIKLPAGALQLPLYDDESPASFNYGALDSVLGHEIIHAFIRQEQQSEESDVNFRLWTDKAIASFKERQECIRKQYSAYEEDGQRLDGRHTLIEDLADIGGLNASLHAYLEEVKRNGNNDILPGLQYNYLQLFFISYAQLWCTTWTKEAVKDKIQNDNHSIQRYRVNGPLSNIREFSEVFRCPLNSKMNLQRKCDLW